MADPKPLSHCHWCGAAWPAGAGWPRTCAACTKTSWRNPLPVAVLVLPVDGGVLAIRRGIEPNRGQLALPGGFINHGESWQEGAARELFEETQIRVDASTIRSLDVISAPDSTLLVFGEAPEMKAKDLPPFEPTDETTERVILPAIAPVCFPLHEQVLRAWFANHPPRKS